MAIDRGSTVVVSSSRPRGVVLGLLGAFAVVMTIVVVYYLLHPETTGPRPEQPSAESLTDVLEGCAGGWLAAVIVWSVLARDVSLAGEYVLVTGAAGRRFALSRTDVKSVHTFPMLNEYFVWLSCIRGAAIGRALFFTTDLKLLADLGSERRG